jgi:hypothetical protein
MSDARAWGPPHSTTRIHTLRVKVAREGNGDRPAIRPPRLSPREVDPRVRGARTATKLQRSEKT